MSMGSLNFEENTPLPDMELTGQAGAEKDWQEKGEPTLHDQLDEGKGFVETGPAGEGYRMNLGYGTENVVVDLGALDTPEVAELHDLALGLAALKAAELKLASKSTLEYIADTIHSAAAARHAH